MPSQIRAFEACEYWKLYKITEYRDGCVYKTQDTGFHIRNGEAIPKDHITVSINCKPNEMVTINLWNER